jgi:DNA-directed RNA polymerase specialized sigma24 family protein
VTEDDVARKLGREFYWPGADRDDVEQEARYWILRARETFRPGKGPFLPFAYFVARRNLIEIVRRETRRRPQFAELQDDYLVTRSLEEQVEIRQRLRLAIEAPLTDLERQALGRAMRGESCSEKSLDNALQRVRRKLAA